MLGQLIHPALLCAGALIQAGYRSTRYPGYGVITLGNMFHAF